MHAIRLIWVNKDVLPNIAKIPRTHAPDAVNCFPWLLIDSGISEQACLEDVRVHLHLLMRCSDTKLVIYKRDLKKSWIILIWAMSCLAACIVLLHSEGKTLEETGTSTGPPPRGHSREGEVRRSPFCSPPRCTDTCLWAVQGKLLKLIKVIIKASYLHGGNTVGSTFHCLFLPWSSMSC